MIAVSCTPKYKLGNIVETKQIGKIGRIISARCVIEWDSKNDGSMLLEYRIGSANDYGNFREDEIKRIVSEK